MYQKEISAGSEKSLINLILRQSCGLIIPNFLRYFELLPIDFTKIYQSNPFFIRMKKFIRTTALVLLGFSGYEATAQNMNITLAAQLSYGTQTLANICGYAAGGHEYALVGAAQGMSIVDVTTPSTPVVITQIPNIDNLWKEIKVYSHYAYVTTEGGGGLQIVDLSNLPNTNLTYHNYTGDGAINGQLGTIHALHIDTTKKFVYLYGSNLFQGGAVVLDINADPYNPTYAGHYTNVQYPYVHDGYVDNDTLYASHIYAGVFTVTDMTNKSAPVTLATQQTPTAFTHNTWLSDDHKTVFTTDENSGSYLGAYDISNLSNIQLTDKIQPTPGSGSIVHNTHILHNWAVTSWYRDGITITDITRPNNIVQVGRYDTYTGSGNGFDGAWGVYPFLPSGTLVVSNIDEGLFVLSPTYVRACYLEGGVTDSLCGSVLNNVTVTISSVNVTDVTNLVGQYATGTAIPGTYNVTFSKPGYNSKTITGVNFAAGVVTNLNVQLYSPNAVNMTGSVTDASNSSGIPNLDVEFVGSNNYNFTTDGSGNFNSCSLVSGTYTVTTGAWGYETTCNQQTVNSSTPTVNIPLNREYYDDFALDLGWTVNSTAASGIWERGAPILTTNNSTPSNPGADVNGDCSNEAYVTGNAGGSASQDDVDNGYTTLTSPAFDLSTYNDPWIHYDRWFYNGGGSGNPNDSLTITLSNGTQTVVLETVTANTANNSTWVHSAKRVSQYITPSNNMHFSVRAVDYGAGHLVEGGLDKWFVVDSNASAVTSQPTAEAHFLVTPNPFNSEAQIRFELPADAQPGAHFEVCDMTGRAVAYLPVSGSRGTVTFNAAIADGFYLVRLVNGNTVSAPLRMAKTK